MLAARKPDFVDAKLVFEQPFFETENTRTKADPTVKTTLKLT